MSSDVDLALGACAFYLVFMDHVCLTLSASLIVFPPYTLQQALLLPLPLSNMSVPKHICTNATDFNEDDRVGFYTVYIRQECDVHYDSTMYAEQKGITMYNNLHVEDCVYRFLHG